MDIRVVRITRDRPEQVEIRCHEVTEEVREIAAFVRSRQGKLSGSMDGRQYEIPMMDIYYIEAVDSRVFLYCSKEVYETKRKLYELEEILREKYFLRVSKSVVLNLMKVRSVKPALNGRFIAILQGGEEIIISRKYVPELKKVLKGGVS